MSAGGPIAVNPLPRLWERESTVHVSRQEAAKSCRATNSRVAFLHFFDYHALRSMKITEALAAEHRIFLSVFDEFERALAHVTSTAEVTTYARVILGLLEAHADTERNLAYLALDHVLSERGQLERLHQEHEEIDASLKVIAEAPNCAAAARCLRAAISATRRHFSFEERHIFPLLENALLQETLQELGNSWRGRFLALETA
jgi:hemerythrin-like domain-containing protein